MRIQRVFFMFFVGAIAALGLVLISNPSSVYADECTWIAGRVGVWSDGNNWTCGFAPDGDDTAILSIGTINLDSDVTVLAFDQSGGTLQGPYDLTVTGALNWTIGTQEGTGRTVIAPGAVMTLLGSGRSLYGRTIENWGSVEWINGNLYLNDGATIENGGTIEFENVDTVTVGQGTGDLGTFWNQSGGVLRKAADGDVLMQVVFNNEGAVEVSAGVFRQGRSGTVSSSSGEFLVGPAGSLEFTSGSHTLGPGSWVHGDGLVQFAVSIVATVLGDYDLDGITVLTGGSVSFEAQVSTWGFVQWGGTLTGGGTLTVTDYFNWQGGRQTGLGKTVLASGASTLIDGTTYVKTLDGRILENWGDLLWAEGTFYTWNGATIDNWGYFEIQADSSLGYATGDVSTFWNQPGGVVRKESTESLAWVRMDFHNEGLVEVMGGTLELRWRDIVSSSSGEFYIGPAGVLDFSSGDHMLGFSSLVHGEGTMQFSGADVEVLGNYDVSGSTDISWSNVTFDDARSVAFGNLLQSSGTLNVDNQATISGNMTRNAGVFNTGSGTITFNGTGEQVISCLGSIDFYNLEIDSGATVVLPSGSLAPTVAGTLTNNGTMVQTLEVDNSGGSGVATFSFLNIGDEYGVDKYYGLDIIVGPYVNMGTTQVSIQGNQTCGSSNTVERCYEIDPLYVTPSTVRFYYRAEEANGNTAPYVWHWNGASWDNVDTTPTRDNADPEGYWVEADGIVSYSPFALSDEEPLPEYEGIIFVKSITLKFQPNGQLVGTVRIIDDDNNAVAGASVSVVWTGPEAFCREQTAQTTKPGTARFRVKVQDSGTYRLTVVGVSLDGWLYDPGQNQETWEEIAVQIN